MGANCWGDVWPQSPRRDSGTDSIWGGHEWWQLFLTLFSLRHRSFPVDPGQQKERKGPALLCSAPQCRRHSGAAAFSEGEARAAWVCNYCVTKMNQSLLSHALLCQLSCREHLLSASWIGILFLTPDTDLSDPTIWIYSMGNIYCNMSANLFSNFMKSLNLCSALMMLHFHWPLNQLLKLFLLDQKATLNQNPILPPSSVTNLSKSHTIFYLSLF